MVERIIQEKLSRRDSNDDFDREFWQKVSHEDRFSAAAQMVFEIELFRGKYASESRLQRSVQSIQRRER